jgi:hypothetical protein
VAVAQLDRVEYSMDTVTTVIIATGIFGLMLLAFAVY